MSDLEWSYGGETVDVNKATDNAETQITGVYEKVRSPHGPKPTKS